MRRTSASRGLRILGTGLILSAVVLALNSWDAVIDVSPRSHAFDQIQIGMEHKQVVDILGGNGRFRSINGPGSVSPGQGPPPPMVAESRWEDAYETVDIQFTGNGVSRVTNITRQPKVPPDPDDLLQVRLGLAFLVIFGLVFLLEGLGARPKFLPAKATSSVPPPTA